MKIDAATQTIILTSNSREWAEKIEQKKLTPLQMTFYERAFKEECTGKHSEVESKECLDLETAKNEGILNIRTLFHPEVVSTFAY